MGKISPTWADEMFHAGHMMTFKRGPVVQSSITPCSDKLHSVDSVPAPNKPYKQEAGLHTAWSSIPDASRASSFISAAELRVLSVILRLLILHSASPLLIQVVSALLVAAPGTLAVLEFRVAKV